MHPIEPCWSFAQNTYKHLLCSCSFHATDTLLPSDLQSTPSYVLESVSAWNAIFYFSIRFRCFFTGKEEEIVSEPITLHNPTNKCRASASSTSRGLTDSRQKPQFSKDTILNPIDTYSRLKSVARGAQKHGDVFIRGQSRSTPLPLKQPRWNVPPGSSCLPDEACY